MKGQEAKASIRVTLAQGGGEELRGDVGREFGGVGVAEGLPGVLAQELEGLAGVVVLGEPLVEAGPGAGGVGGVAGPAHEGGDQLPGGVDQVGGGLVFAGEDAGLEGGEEFTQAAPEGGGGEGSAGVVGEGARDAEAMRGAGEGDVGQEVFVEQLPLGVGVDVDVLLLEKPAFGVGEDGVFARDAGEEAFVHADENDGTDVGVAGAFDFADEDLIDGGGREGQVELFQAGFEDFEEVGGGDGFAAEQVGHLVHQFGQLGPDLLVLVALLELVGVFGFVHPTGEGLADLEPLQKVEQLDDDLAQGDGLGRLETGEEVLKGLEHPAAQGVGTGGFVAFAGGDFVFGGAGNRAAIGPGLDVGPGLAVDAVQEDVVFHGVGFMQRQTGQAAFEQGHDRLVRPMAQGDLKGGTDELQQRMVGDLSAAVQKVGDVVFGETGIDQLVIRLHVAGQNGNVAKTIALVEQRANVAGGSIDFAAPVGGFDQVDVGSVDRLGRRIVKHGPLDVGEGGVGETMDFPQQDRRRKGCAFVLDRLAHSAVGLFDAVKQA